MLRFVFYTLLGVLVAGAVSAEPRRIQIGDWREKMIENNRATNPETVLISRDGTRGPECIYRLQSDQLNLIVSIEVLAGRGKSILADSFVIKHDSISRETMTELFPIKQFSIAADLGDERDFTFYSEFSEFSDPIFGIGSVVSTFYDRGFTLERYFLNFLRLSEGFFVQVHFADGSSHLQYLPISEDASEKFRQYWDCFDEAIKN